MKLLIARRSSAVVDLSFTLRPSRLAALEGQANDRDLVPGRPTRSGRIPTVKRLIFAVALAAYTPAAKAGEVDSRLAYLLTIEGVSGIATLHGNQVYLGVSELPADVAWIAAGAALKGDEVAGRGVHVYIVRAADLKDVPAVQILCSASARHGRVTLNTCK
jgi:hypothetical protein